MYLHPYPTQLLAQERMKDMLRQAEQQRLIRRAAKDPRKVWARRLPVKLIASSLFRPVIRPQRDASATL